MDREDLSFFTSLWSKSQRETVQDFFVCRNCAFSFWVFSSSSSFGNFDIGIGFVISWRLVAWQGVRFVSKRIHNELKVGYEGGRQRRILFGCYLVTGPVFAGNYLLVDSLLNFARRVVQVFQVFHDKQMKELEERETNVCYSILSSLALFNLMQSNK